MGLNNTIIAWTPLPPLSRDLTLLGLAWHASHILARSIACELEHPEPGCSYAWSSLHVGDAGHSNMSNLHQVMPFSKLASPSVLCGLAERCVGGGRRSLFQDPKLYPDYCGLGSVHYSRTGGVRKLPPTPPLLALLPINFVLVDVEEEPGS